MRILHVIHEYDYAEGMGRTMDTISTRNGLSNALLCAKIKRRSDSFCSVTVSRFLNPISVRREVLNSGADVVHFHGGVFSALMGAVTPVRGVKKVATIYGWPRVQRRLNGLSLKQMWGTPPLNKRVLLGCVIPTKLAALLLRRLVVITPDAGVHARLLSRGVCVLNYETATYPAPRKNRRTTGNPVVLAMAGRAELTRGADTFMGVVASMNARGIPTKGVIALLPGPHSGAIAQLGRGRRDVDILTEPTDLAEVFSGVDVVVMPFRADYTTSPPVLVAEEALACGVPVVTSDVVCMRTAVDDSCAVVLSKHSVRDYADAVEEILTDQLKGDSLREGAVARPGLAWARSNVVSVALDAYTRHC